MPEKPVPPSGPYLKDCWVVVDYPIATRKEGDQELCPSISRWTDLWKVILDSLPDELSDVEVHDQAFADDVILVSLVDRSDLYWKEPIVYCRSSCNGDPNKFKFASQKLKSWLRES
ncbi:hypothetical protein EVAR_97398_1 [Eumeta japonica]|uniref:Reverse transcriptase domain-containing protein n=1 Tax=Eumeta variegata TaxID=151549 RepID=A0A4C1SB32_EUMVA|nr:hypothetical protein EVAR_97398_1 [Eumeta japonica]